MREKTTKEIDERIKKAEASLMRVREQEDAITKRILKLQKQKELIEAEKKTPSNFHFLHF